MLKNLPDNAGDARDTGPIPGSVRSPGVGNNNPLQYSCLHDSTDTGAWWVMVCGVTKNWTQYSYIDAPRFPNAYLLGTKKPVEKRIHTLSTALDKIGWNT